MKKVPVIHWKKLLIGLLLIGSAGAALKCIFVSLQMDEEYAISMSYRLVQGDRLLTQLWDPHQTSAFLIEFLIWAYLKLFHTTTCLVLWIRFWGVMMHLAVTCCLYRTLRAETGREESFFLAVIYFNLLPKGYVMPEFSNMMVWSLTMLVICLTGLARREAAGTAGGQDGTCKATAWDLRMTVLTAGAGIWLCLATLSYPTCALLYPFLLVYLWKYDRYRKRTMGLLTLIVLLIGGCYLGYLLSYMTPVQLVENIRSLIASNAGAHPTNKLIALQTYGVDALVLGVYAAAYLGLTNLALALYRMTGIGKQQFPQKPSRMVRSYVLLWIAFGYLVIHWILMQWQYERSYPYVVYFFLLVFGICAARRLGSGSAGSQTDEPQTDGLQARQMAFLWIGSGFVMLFAILLLTNLTIATSVKYLMPAVIAAMLLFLRYSRQHAPQVWARYARGTLLLWCFAAIFVKGWAYPDNDGLMKNITCVGNIISEGPAKGVITEYLQGYMQESDYQEFRTYISPGDHLLVMDVSTLCYLYQDVTVAGSSTICSPTFDANLLDYWQRNPDRYPDVIAVPCWYGELKYDPDSWMMHWIETKYQASRIIDGKYFRYYIR